jgi:Flp pilus assembly protein TadG
MLVLYIAGNEVSQSIAIYRKVAQVSYTVGDLITQVSSVQSADITDVLAAGNAVMLPYQASGAQIVVSALNYNGSGYSVAWSKASGSGAALGKGSAPPANYNIPAGIISTPASSCTSSTTPPCPQIVVAQVSYTYTTPFTSIMNSTVFFQKSIWGSNSITLSDIIYMRPRLSVSIPCADC